MKIAVKLGMNVLETHNTRNKRHWEIGKMSEWQGSLTKIQAIKLIERATDHPDPFWEYLVEDFYDEASDTMPSIFHVFAALGVTEEEYKQATGAENISWP